MTNHPNRSKQQQATHTPLERELLAALKDLELFMSQCGYFNSPGGRKLALQTRAAIAKAEGR